MCKKEECVIVEVGYWIDKERGHFKRKEFMPFDVINVIRKLRDNKGIFKTAYRYNVISQNEAELFGDLYFDFDSDEYIKTKEDVLKALAYLKVVFGINDNEYRLFFSGNKGFHIVVPAEVLDITPNKNLNNIFKAIVREVKKYTDNETLDMRIYDNKRLFRIENSIHEKTNLYKVEITKAELLNLTEVEIKDIAKNPRKNTNKIYRTNTECKRMYKYFVEQHEKLLKENEIKLSNNATKKMKYMPPCIKEILENGPINGQRNNTIAVLASFFKLYGKEFDEAKNLINEWNNTKCSTPLPKFEVDRTTQSIYSGNKAFGCSSIKDLNLCSKEGECKFKK